jgi:hypothetical protein
VAERKKGSSFDEGTPTATHKTLVKLTFDPAWFQTTLRSLSKVRQKSYTIAVAAPRSRHFCVKLWIEWGVSFTLGFSYLIITHRRRLDRGTTASRAGGEAVMRGSESWRRGRGRGCRLRGPRVDLSSRITIRWTDDSWHRHPINKPHTGTCSRKCGNLSLSGELIFGVRAE